MWNVRGMVETWREFRGGAPLGDVAVLKFAAMSPTAPKGIVDRLEKVRGYAPTVDMEHLRSLPGGTLGREYARFLDTNGIDPLQVSDSIQERFADNPYVLRYTVTHDLHHVLTGFDAGLAGEIGVFAFTIAQGSAPASTGMLRFAKVFYPLLSPTQARQIWTNTKVGLAMGQRAKLLLAEPLESYFEQPLVEVRQALGIPDAEAAGVRTSGTSVLAKLVYANRPALSCARKS